MLAKNKVKMGGEISWRTIYSENDVQPSIIHTGLLSTYPAIILADKRKNEQFFETPPSPQP